ncbi:zf-HC2 domain-containing protein [Cryptosporangium aurantiacum]|uniref:Predicted anti-sigma-YlaC factor YlaD, contains Zn-finger domain n=1 Tax=Cryptosporangium aurantiacum TaxID=134849 RepID=A0A1M7QE95_9ACTN|nr:zf-HC2 domain-containing protein [Cryptosporangium aurantiacum]SHN29010.1 Predicted anti-sigma-YlaC factor YlaD, contains Zn-finger domain [Cryptosporangium aurantiacum]
MQCAQIRVALSALADDEDPGIDRDDVDAHLTGCTECRAWHAAAADATAAARAGWRREADVPDLTAEVLAAVAADRRPRKAARAARAGAGAPAGRSLVHAGVLRWALGLSAVAQLLLALPAMLADPGIGDAASHTGREMASFDVAVAIGFLFVAGRPAWARALVPLAVALAGCLLLTSSIDVIDGAAQLGHELNHLLAGVQAVLVWLLARTDRTPVGPEPFSGDGTDRTVPGQA